MSYSSSFGNQDTEFLCVNNCILWHPWEKKSKKHHKMNDIETKLLNTIRWSNHALETLNFQGGKQQIDTMSCHHNW